MYSELLRIPITWNGVPIFGFGVLLLVWLGFSAWGMAATARMSDWQTAVRAHLATVLIIAGAISIFIPRYFPDGVPIRGYGVMVLAGSIAGIALAIHRARQAGVAAEEIMGLAVAMFIGGVLGARLFYVIEYWEKIREPTWGATIWNILRFTEGGLVVYGAFIGAMIGFSIYVRRRSMPTLATADMIAAGMVIGLAFGRIGCLLNGCCYGGESSVPWAVTFPLISPPYADQAAAGRFYGFRIGESPGVNSVTVRKVYPETPASLAGLKEGDVISGINGNSLMNSNGAYVLIVKAMEAAQPLELKTNNGLRRLTVINPPERSLPVHPAQVYSSITAFLLAWVLWSYYPFRRRDGEVIALMITLYPIARFFEEMIRVDEPSVFGTGLSISQNISIGLFVMALGLWVWLLRRPRGLAFQGAVAPGV
jgi:phosphatidylglycerol---prolipoprotein diacylglyceryl transferase